MEILFLLRENCKLTKSPLSPEGGIPKPADLFKIGKDFKISGIFKQRHSPLQRGKSWGRLIIVSLQGGWRVLIQNWVSFKLFASVKKIAICSK